MATPKYELSRIRNLLLEGFDAQDLHQFCYYSDKFREACNRFATNPSMNGIVDTLVDFAEHRLQMEALLDYAREQRPDRYLQHGPYISEERALMELARRRMEEIFGRGSCTPTLIGSEFGLSVSLYDGEWRAKGMRFSVQFEARETLDMSNGEINIRCPVDRARVWMEHGGPVMLVLYDVQEEVAYWIWTQPYLADLEPSWPKQGSVPIAIPLENTLNKESVEAIHSDISSMVQRAWATSSAREQPGPTTLEWLIPIAFTVGSALILTLPEIKALLQRRRDTVKDELEAPVAPSPMTQPAARRPAEREEIILLRRYLSEERATGEDLETLAAHLGHEPQALVLAGCYLGHRKRSLTVIDYLEDLKAILNAPAGQELRRAFGDPTDGELYLMAAFVLNWTEVKGKDARHLFGLAGYCAPQQPIPRELLQKASALPDRTFKSAVTQLINLGFLQEDLQERPVIPPSLVDYARHVAAPTDALDKLVNALSELAAQANKDNQPTRFAPLRPHLETLAAVIQGLALALEPRGQMKKARALWRDLGCHLDMIADYAGAREAFGRATEIAKRLDDRTALAADWNDLAIACARLGDLHIARQYAAESLRFRAEPEPSIRIASSLRTAGLVELCGDCPDEAYTYLVEALEQLRELSERRGIGQVYITLADTLRHLSARSDRPKERLFELRQAAEHAQEAVEIFVESDTDRLNLVEAWCVLGCVYQQWIRLDPRERINAKPDIESLMRKGEDAFRLAIEAAGDELLYQNLNARVHLSWLYHSSGEFDLARSEILEALTHFPPDSYVQESVPYLGTCGSQESYRLLKGRAYLLLGEIAWHECCSGKEPKCKESQRLFILASVHLGQFGYDDLDSRRAKDYAATIRRLGLSAAEPVPLYQRPQLIRGRDILLFSEFSLADLDT